MSKKPPNYLTGAEVDAAVEKHELHQELESLSEYLWSNGRVDAGFKVDQIIEKYFPPKEDKE